MGFNIQLYFVFILMSSEISCRSIDPNTVANKFDVGISSNSTETASISFDICEFFHENHDDINQMKLSGNGITVITKLFWQLWLRQVSLLSKLEVRFHSAGHNNVKFIIITQNESNAERIRNYSRQLEVIVISKTQNNKLSLLEDRSTYIFDNSGRIVYVIHYPFNSVQKSFLKAAILSTIFDSPCSEYTVSLIIFVASYHELVFFNYLFRMTKGWALPLNMKQTQ